MADPIVFLHFWGFRPTPEVRPMSCIQISSNAGVKLYIAAQTNLPADMAVTNWEAITGTNWVEVSQASSLGQRGSTRQIIEFKGLDGVVCKQKGSTNYGTMSFEVADIPEDDGQVLMTTANDSNLNFPFKIVHDDATATLVKPTVEYFPGMVGTWAMSPASDSDSIRMRSAEVALNGYLYDARAAS